MDDEPWTPKESTPMSSTHSDKAGLALFTLILVTVGALYLGIRLARAGTFTNMFDKMTRQTVSALSSHTIKMTMATGSTWAASETLTIDFNEDGGGLIVNGAGTTASDFDITTVKGGSVTEANVVTSCGAGANDISFSIDDVNGIITLTTCSSFTTTDAATQIVIEYGTAATFGGAGVNKVTNPAIAGSYDILLNGTIGDTGTLKVATLDADQIQINAIVDPGITFDMDVALTDVETAAPYTVNLGPIPVNAVRTSGLNNVPFIWIDIGHNGTGGAVITVQSQNGALTSQSILADAIPSSTATLVGGTEGYGLCVDTVTQTTGGPLSKAAPFDGTCTDTGHAVGQLTTSPSDILNTSATTIDGGRAKISVKAARSATTEAHQDYRDALTIIATVTY